MNKIIILFSCLFISVNAFGSPTSSDFKKCHKLKAKVLEYCLNESLINKNNANADDICQEKSHKAYNGCHKQVVKTYTPLSQAEQDAILKRQAALMKQKQLEEQQKLKENM